MIFIRGSIIAQSALWSEIKTCLDGWVISQVILKIGFCLFGLVSATGIMFNIGILLGIFKTLKEIDILPSLDKYKTLCRIRKI